MNFANEELVELYLIQIRMRTTILPDEQHAKPVQH